jgi:hypothetical protein
MYSRGEDEIAFLAFRILAKEVNDVIEGPTAADWRKLMLVADKNDAIERARLMHLKRSQHERKMR